MENFLEEYIRDIKVFKISIKEHGRARAEKWIPYLIEFFKYFGVH